MTRPENNSHLQPSQARAANDYCWASCHQVGLQRSASPQNKHYYNLSIPDSFQIDKSGALMQIR